MVTTGHRQVLSNVAQRKFLKRFQPLLDQQGTDRLTFILFFLHIVTKLDHPAVCVEPFHTVILEGSRSPAFSESLLSTYKCLLRASVKLCILIRSQSHLLSLWMCSVLQSLPETVASHTPFCLLASLLLGSLSVFAMYM